MASLLAVLVLSALVAVLTVDRPVRAVAVALVVWSLLPAVAASRVTGVETGPLATHPATWILLVTLVVQLVLRPEPLTRTVAAHPFVWLGLVLFVAVLLTTTLAAGGSGLKTVADQVVGPLALFWIVCGAAADRPRDLRLLRTTILGVAAFQALVSIAQFRAGSILFFESDFLTLYWFDPETATRWMGTLDSPLVLSTLVVVAAPLTLGLRSNVLRFALLLLYFAAAAITQSRTGLGIIGLVGLYVLVRARLGALQKIGLAVLGAAGAAVVAGSALLAGVSERLADDTGSTQARGDALAFVARSWREFLLVGGGSGSSYETSAQGGLITSLENALLMYAVDAGIVFALLYFGIQVAIPLLRRREVAMPGLAVACVVGVVVQLSYSSVAASSMVGVLVWTTLAMVVTDADRTRDDTSPARPPAGPGTTEPTGAVRV